MGLAGGEIERPELVDPSHGDEESAPGQRHIPGRRQRSITLIVARAELPARPGDRPDLARAEIHGADRVVPCIGHV